MPIIKPISYLRKTAEVVKLCDKSNEPIYLTKNGYSSLVVMNEKTYDRLTNQYIENELEKGMKDIKNNKTIDLDKALKILNKKYNRNKLIA